MASRYTYIDIAKGIGILLIVLGHNNLVAYQNGELFNVLFSFHVPLFFFLSGVFINPNYELQKHIMKRVDSYLKPYFVTLIFLGIIIFPYEGVDTINYFAKVLYGTGPVLPMGFAQLWFLPHLFAVSVFSYLCFVKANLMSKSYLLKATVLIIIFSTGYIGISDFWNVQVAGTNIILLGLPFSMDIILLSSSYFLLGSFLSREVFNFQFNWCMFMFAVVVFAFIHFKFNYTIDFNRRRYDNVIICAIASLVGIYIVISFSKLIQDTSIISKILSYIGTCSLFVLIFHNYIQMKTIIFLKASLAGNKYIIIPAIAFASFTIAVLVPILLYEIVRRQPALKMLFLPLKFNKAIQADEVAPRR